MSFGEVSLLCLQIVFSAPLMHCCTAKFVMKKWGFTFPNDILEFLYRLTTGIWKIIYYIPFIIHFTLAEKNANAEKRATTIHFRMQIFSTFHFHVQICYWLHNFPAICFSVYMKSPYAFECKEIWSSCHDALDTSLAWEQPFLWSMPVLSSDYHGWYKRLYLKLV